MLEEEERQSVNAEALAEMFTEVREQHVLEQAAALEARATPGATPQEPLATGPGPLGVAGAVGGGETEPILLNGDVVEEDASSDDRDDGSEKDTGRAPLEPAKPQG